MAAYRPTFGAHGGSTNAPARRARAYFFSALVGVLALAAWGSPATTSAAEDDRADAEGIEFFERAIRPLLVKHCYECHSSDADELKGGLALDHRAGWQTGGDSGPAIVPGDPEASPLIEAVKYEGFEMPPSGRLADEDIALLEAWIRRGAPDPRLGEPSSRPSAANEIDWEQARQFWSFRPIGHPAVPDVKDETWPRTEIDRFILSRLETEGRAPGAPVARGALLRRLSFDLVGLPPTMQELANFEQDRSADAVERVIDRLLASPRFGERWGRHWLDVARYADSTGGGRSLLYDAAWRYRDYVIRAFSSDKPFNRFIVEQIAGDLLPYDDYRAGGDQLVATGFLALGPTNYELQDKQQLRMDVVDEQLDTIGRAFLGMTIGCARCHDHKFDPIPASDYYAMAGILRSTQSLVDANVSSWVRRDLPLPPEEQQQLDEYDRQVAELGARADAAKRDLEELQAALDMVTLDDSAATLAGDWMASTSVKPFVGKNYRYANDTANSASFTLPVETAGEYEVRVSYTPHPNRDRAAQYTIFHAHGDADVQLDQTEPPSLDGLYASLGRFDFAAGEAARVVVRPSGKGALIVDGLRLIAVGESSDADAEAYARLAETESTLAKIVGQQKALTDAAPGRPPIAMSVAEQDEPGDCPIHIRGDLRNLGAPSPRGFLTIAAETPRPKIPPHASGRLALARWLADDANSLTPRVTVNRVWHHLFGVGLVATVDNFGAMGQQPSHPELLDYLAREFIDDGWSVKRLIREIARSRTYQTSSQSDPLVLAADPENRLLAHQNRRRLDAEALRDSILFLSGQLEFSAGGNPIRPGTKNEYGYRFDDRCRSVHLPVFRNQLHDLMVVFDFPDPNLSVSRRTTSTLATQSLFLMNSPFVIEQSDRAAARLLEDPDLDDAQRVEQLYLSALARPPTDDEARLARAFIDDTTTSEDDRQTAWAALCQAVIATIDFRYLD